MAGLLLRKGRIWTGDPDRPWAESLLSEGNLISGVGTAQQFNGRLTPETEIIDLQGAVVLPGFCDSHVHLTEWAKREKQLKLDNFKSLAELLEYVKKNLPDDEWIIGGGWNYNLWSEGRLPRSDDLNFISPLQKVIFFSKDFHSVWVNDAVIDMLEPRDLARYLDAGQIRTNELGQVTGVFVEDAMIRLIVPLVDAQPSPLYNDAPRLFEQFFQYGITSLHSIETFENYRALRNLYQDRVHRGPRLSVYIYHHDRDRVISSLMKSGDGGPWFRFMGLKYFLDGALGSQTAWMKEPYIGSDSRGVRIWRPDELRQALAGTEENGLKLAVHAIGDAALEEALDILESRRPYKGIRDRIEHAQIVDEDLLEALQRIQPGITANPSHLLTDFPTAEKYWGERSRYAFAYRSMLDRNLALAFASDAPVESIDPWLSINAAVNRVPYYSGVKWTPQECISIDEAIRAMTVTPAVLTGEEERKGKLLPGYLADFFVCSKDPFRSSDSDLSGIRSELTVIDGRSVYRRSR